MTNLTKKPEWIALAAHQTKMADVHMRDLFAADPKRFEALSLSFDNILLDYSKNRITDETMALLIALLESSDFNAWREKFFAGAPINNTEDRPVQHMACRAGSSAPPEVKTVLAQMRQFCDRVRNGNWTGFSGKHITDIVHIGIGGSNLGPKMVTEALTPWHHPRLCAHFVSNIDGTDISETLNKINPETALFIIASKSFTTQETMTNARTAKNRVLDYFGDEKAVARHFVALSTNTEAVEAFGIDPANMFAFWDWVGGRYSTWLAIGLPIAVMAGMDKFEEFLGGAHQMDEHFRTTVPAQNLPVILGLLGIWYRNFWNAPTYAVMPYDAYLRNFPTWLQQVDMESNGKCIDREGQRVSYPTGPIAFGAPGTDAQHSFFQLIHQGTDIIPCDFIGFKNPAHDTGDHHKMLLSNYLAQSKALMMGRENSESPQRGFEGNKPSTSILLDKLTPRSLGMLMALYEHKVFVQGVIWNINSFDQWGVELGKSLSRDILSGDISDADSSTKSLLNRIYKNLA